MDTTQTSEATSTPAGVVNDGLDGFDARVDALLAESRAEEAAKPPLGLLDDVEPTEAAPPVAQPTDADKARQARRERLARLSAQERSHVDAQQKHAERDQMARQLAEAQARARSLEESTAGRIDPSKLDEASFFELAHKAGISPQKLGEFLAMQAQDPSALAAQRAQQALDPRISAAEAEARAVREEFRQYVASQQRAQAEAQENALRSQFVESITPQSAPRAAAFAAKFGGAELLKIADAAANSLPAGANSQDLIDEIEEKLGELASAFGVQTQPSSKHAFPPNPSAAAKAITVSNSHAQDRATVVDDDDFASLPLEERAKRLIAAI